MLALALALCACASTRDSDDAALRQLASDVVQSVNDADLDRFVSFFATDASAFFPSPANRARVRGVDAIRAAVAPAFAAKPANPLVLKDLEIRSDGDFAVVSFDVGSQNVNSRRTFVVRRFRDGWKVVHLHASNLRPPGE